MTVFVHGLTTEIVAGDHSHVVPDGYSMEESRTWSFDCSRDGCELRVLRDVEHVANTAEGVPLTELEKVRAERMQAQANESMAQMAMGLGKLIRDGALTTTAASPVGI